MHLRSPQLGQGSGSRWCVRMYVCDCDGGGVAGVGACRSLSSSTQPCSPTNPFLFPHSQIIHQGKKSNSNCCKPMLARSTLSPTAHLQRGCKSTIPQTTPLDEKEKAPSPPCIIELCDLLRYLTPLHISQFPKLQRVQYIHVARRTRRLA